MTAASEPKKILLFEDDPDLVNLLLFRFKREGYEIEHVADGAAAISRLDDANIPDLVVSDVMMPHHSGFEVLAELRSRESWRDVPVIMLTSKDGDQDVLRGLELGANDYLGKPFRPAELIARAQRLLKTR